MNRDPLAMTAAVAAARVLGADCMLALFVTEEEAPAVSGMICEVMGVGLDKVTFRSPTSERYAGVFGWGEDGDGKTVSVNLHVCRAIANDNQKEGA